MDNETLARLDVMLQQPPESWDDITLDAILGDAAQREADGEPIASSYPQVAAFLARHPGAAKAYRSLVWLVEQERKPAMVLLPVPQALRARLTPVPPPAPAQRGPFWLRLSLGTVRGSGQQVVPGASVSEIRQPLEGSPLEALLRLRVEDREGSIFFRLSGAEGLDGRDVLLYAVEQTTIINAVPNTPPLEQDTLDADGSVMFLDLNPEQAYLLAVDPAGAPIYVHIEADMWPRG